MRHPSCRSSDSSSSVRRLIKQRIQIEMSVCALIPIQRRGEEVQLQTNQLIFEREDLSPFLRKPGTGFQNSFNCLGVHSRSCQLLERRERKNERTILLHNHFRNKIGRSLGQRRQERNAPIFIFKNTDSKEYYPTRIATSEQRNS